MQVAETIYKQLGGSRFSMMVGAKDLVGGDNYLSFKVMKNSKKVTHVVVTYLHGSDLYRMEFKKWNARKLSMETLSSVEGVYCDQLVSVFERNTELYGSL